MYKMIFLVNQKTNWDFPAKKKILDHYKKPRINLKRTIAVLGKLGFYLNYVGCKGKNIRIKFIQVKLVLP